MSGGSVEAVGWVRGGRVEAARGEEAEEGVVRGLGANASSLSASSPSKSNDCCLVRIDVPVARPGSATGSGERIVSCTSDLFNRVLVPIGGRQPVRR